MKPKFTVVASAGTVGLVMDAVRARAIAEAIEHLDLTGADAEDVRDLRAGADDADRLAAAQAARAAARPSLRLAGGDDRG